ncbi:MAG: gas vesicle protein [Gemmatimonadota bacterium]
MAPSRSQGLVDVLDRVLDKGLVIAGDIKVNLANVELLTIQVRLLVCSIDKAEQIGLNWWKFDPALSGGRESTRLEDENRDLKERLRLLEERLERSEAGNQ